MVHLIQNLRKSIIVYLERLAAMISSVIISFYDFFTTRIVMATMTMRTTVFTMKTIKYFFRLYISSLLGLFVLGFFNGNHKLTTRIRSNNVYCHAFSATTIITHNKYKKYNERKNFNQFVIQMAVAGAGGFGMKPNSNKKKRTNTNKKAIIGYEPDTSYTTQQLIKFLQEEECEGIAEFQTDNNVVDDIDDGGIEIGYCKSTGRRGVYAKQNFSPGEYLCAIPFVSSLVLHRMEQEQQQNDDDSSSSNTTTTTSPTDAQLGLLFLQNYYYNHLRQTNSRTGTSPSTVDTTDISIPNPTKWEAFFNCLPNPPSSSLSSSKLSSDDSGLNFDPTPDFFTEEEIQLLEFPRIVSAALQRKQDIEREAKLYEESADNENNRSIQDVITDLQFTTWLVKSRSFSILKAKKMIDDETKNDHDATTPNDQEEANDNIEPLTMTTKTMLETKTVMIPFVDMINHQETTPNAQLRVIETKLEEESFYAVQATQIIRKNEEITISYGTGKDTSMDIFLNYGFVPITTTDRNAGASSSLPNPNDVSFLQKLIKRQQKVQKAQDSDYDDNRHDNEEEKYYFIRQDQWSTTLNEDEEELNQLVEKSKSTTIQDNDESKPMTTGSGNNNSSIMQRILEFRIQMKLALQEALLVLQRSGSKTTTKKKTKKVNSNTKKKKKKKK